MKSIEAVLAYIQEKEGEEQKILQILHSILISNPTVTTKLSYGLPFYFQHRRLCYLHPLKKGGVELVFTQGPKLSNRQGLLKMNGRISMCGISFQSSKEINAEALREIIFEALYLDEENKKQRTRK